MSFEDDERAHCLRVANEIARNAMMRVEPGSVDILMRERALAREHAATDRDAALAKIDRVDEILRVPMQTPEAAQLQLALWHALDVIREAQP